MKKALTLAIALTLSACSSSARNVCNKAKECCATMSICESINKSGANWEDRCEISLQAKIDTLATFNSDLCDKVASTYVSMIDCTSGVACTDISNTPPTNGVVTKCDTQAKAYCAALKASGDACGGSYGNLDCTSYSANLAKLY